MEAAQRERERELNTVRTTSAKAYVYIYTSSSMPELVIGELVDFHEITQLHERQATTPNAFMFNVGNLVKANCLLAPPLCSYETPHSSRGKERRSLMNRCIYISHHLWCSLQLNTCIASMNQ